VELELSNDTVHITLEDRPGGSRNARVHRASEGLKYHRRHADGTDAYFLVNESDQPLEGLLRLVGGKCVEEWTPDSGVRHPLPSVAQTDGRQEVTITFAPRQSRLLVLEDGSPAVKREPDQLIRTIDLLSWQMTVGEINHLGPLVSWTALGNAYYSGIGHYQTTVNLEAGLHPGEYAVLDLGTVLETVQVTINDTALPPLDWAPYQLEITNQLVPGINVLNIQVANTNANAFELSERPSGLFGPVQVRILRKS